MENMKKEWFPILLWNRKTFNMEYCLDKQTECVVHGLFDATSQAQTGFHTFLNWGDNAAEGE